MRERQGLQESILTGLAVAAVVLPVLLPAFFGVAFPPLGLVVGAAAGGALGLVFGIVARRSPARVLALVGIAFSATALAFLVGVFFYLLVPSGPFMPEGWEAIGPGAQSESSAPLFEVPAETESGPLESAVPDAAPP